MTRIIIEEFGKIGDKENNWGCIARVPMSPIIYYMKAHYEYNHFVIRKDDNSVMNKMAGIVRADKTNEEALREIHDLTKKVLVPHIRSLLRERDIEINEIDDQTRYAPKPSD